MFKISEVTATELIRMPFEACSFEMPDPRSEDNCKYLTQDYVFCAFACYFFQNKDFLDSQRRLETIQNISNMTTLFGVDEIPTNDEIKDVIDNIDPTYFYHVYYDALEWLRKNRFTGKFDVLCGKFNIIALDEINIFKSQKIKDYKLVIDSYKDSVIDYNHGIIAASLVSPHTNITIPLPPAFLAKNSSNKKQDYIQDGLYTWIDENTSPLSHSLTDRQFIILANDLYCHKSNIELFKIGKYNFMLNCEPSNNKKLSECLENKLLNSIEYLDHVDGFKNDKLHKIEWLNSLPLYGTGANNSVNWFRLTIEGVKKVKVEIQQAKNEKIKNNKKVFATEHHDITFSFITNMEINSDNVKEFCDIGRSRWKIKNNNFHVLKYDEYDFTHNYGRGIEFLDSTLATFNIIASLFHSILYLSADTWTKKFNSSKNRNEFFETLNNLFKFMIFHSFDDFILYLDSKKYYLQR
jgi:hypothetical protein